VIITNDHDTTTRNLIRQYARRMTIEQRLASGIGAGPGRGHQPSRVIGELRHRLGLLGMSPAITGLRAWRVRPVPLDDPLEELTLPCRDWHPHRVRLPLVSAVRARAGR